MDKTKIDLVKENTRLKHRNRELEFQLGIRKQKNIFCRVACAIRAFFNEFYRV